MDICQYEVRDRVSLQSSVSLPSFKARYQYLQSVTSKLGISITPVTLQLYGSVTGVTVISIGTSRVGIDTFIMLALRFFIVSLLG